MVRAPAIKFSDIWENMSKKVLSLGMSGVISGSRTPSQDVCSRAGQYLMRRGAGSNKEPRTSEGMYQEGQRLAVETADGDWHAARDADTRQKNDQQYGACSDGGAREEVEEDVIEAHGLSIRRLRTLGELRKCYAQLGIREGM